LRRDGVEISPGKGLAANGRAGTWGKLTSAMKDKPDE